MVEGHQCHRVAAAHRRLLVGRAFLARSPNGRFKEGAAAIHSKLLQRIEVHGKNLFYFFGGPPPTANSPTAQPSPATVATTSNPASVPDPAPEPDPASAGPSSTDEGTPSGPSRTRTRTLTRKHTGGASATVGAEDGQVSPSTAAAATAASPVSASTSFATSPVVMHIHFGMSGAFRTMALPGPPPTETTRLELINREMGLVAHLSAMTVAHGSLELYDSKAAQLGPDPLREDADKELLWSKLCRCRKPIGLVLMDQSMMAGVGNIYRAEILFKAGLHPETPAAAVSRETFERIWYHSVDLLQRGFVSGSIITVDPEEARVLGKPWTRRYIYNQKQCGRCKGPVRTWDMANRTVYCCENCQPLQQPQPPAITAAAAAAGRGSNPAAAAAEGAAGDAAVGVGVLSAARLAAMAAARPARVFRSHCAPDDSEDESLAPGKMTVKQLRSRLTSLNLDTRGTKAQLVIRLEAARAWEGSKGRGSQLKGASQEEEEEEEEEQAAAGATKQEVEPRTPPPCRRASRQRQQSGKQQHEKQEEEKPTGAAAEGEEWGQGMDTPLLLRRKHGKRPSDRVARTTASQPGAPAKRGVVLMVDTDSDGNDENGDDEDKEGAAEAAAAAAGPRGGGAGGSGSSSGDKDVVLVKSEEEEDVVVVEEKEGLGVVAQEAKRSHCRTGLEAEELKSKRRRASVNAVAAPAAGCRRPRRSTAAGGRVSTGRATAAVPVGTAGLVAIVGGGASSYTSGGNGRSGGGSADEVDRAEQILTDSMAADAPGTASTPQLSDLPRLTLAQLRTRLRDLSLPVSGTKAILLQRLTAAVTATTATTIHRVGGAAFGAATAAADAATATIAAKAAAAGPEGAESTLPPSIPQRPPPQSTQPPLSAAAAAATPAPSDAAVAVATPVAAAVAVSRPAPPKAPRKALGWPRPEATVRGGGAVVQSPLGPRGRGGALGDGAGEGLGGGGGLRQRPLYDIMPGIRGLEEKMLSAKDAALEKLMAGENRAVEHVALEDQEALALRLLAARPSNRPAGRVAPRGPDPGEASDTVADQMPDFQAQVQGPVLGKMASGRARKRARDVAAAIEAAAETGDAGAVQGSRDGLGGFMENGAEAVGANEGTESNDAGTAGPGLQRSRRRL